MAEGSTGNDLEVISDMLEEDTDVIVSLDIDNPIKEPGPYMEPHPGVLEGIGTLLNAADAVTFNSGKPLDYQRALRERYSQQIPEIADVDLIGGMGTVAEIDGEIYHFGGELDESLPDFLEVKQNIFAALAENGWKANMQNNRSYDVGVTRVEAENGAPRSRGHSSANPLFSDIPTGQLYNQYLQETDGFRFDPSYDRESHPGQGAVVFNPAPDNIHHLSEIARIEEPFIGLRFEQIGDQIGFYRDPRDRDLEEDEVRQRLERAIKETGADWNIAHHSDGGTEYWKPGIGKESGLDRYMDLKSDGAVAIHIGDSESDWIENDRVTTIPQYGTDLYEMVSPNHDLKPGDVSDFSEMFARAAGRERRGQY